jgi:hypothetical protein
MPAHGPGVVVDAPDEALEGPLDDLLGDSTVVVVLLECVAAAFETAVPTPRLRPNEPATIPKAASGFVISFTLSSFVERYLQESSQSALPGSTLGAGSGPS